MQCLEVMGSHVEGVVAVRVRTLAEKRRPVRAAGASDHLIHVAEEVLRLNQPLLADMTWKISGCRPTTRTTGSGVANERTTSADKSCSFRRFERAAARSNSNAAST